VVTLYFCLDGNAPVLRYWPFVPRIGEAIVLPELGNNLSPLRVVDVVCEGYDEPSISVYLHDSRQANRTEQSSAEDGEMENPW
jgi:hypothetical protein